MVKRAGRGRGSRACLPSPARRLREGCGEDFVVTGGESALFLNAGISGQMGTRRSLVVIPPRSLTSSTKPGFFPAVGCLHNPLSNANSLMKLTPRQEASVCNTGQGTVRDSFCCRNSSSAALRRHACPAAGGWAAGAAAARQALPEQTAALRCIPAARPARSRRGTCRCFKTRPCNPLVIISMEQRKKKSAFC